MFYLVLIFLATFPAFQIGPAYIELSHALVAGELVTIEGHRSGNTRYTNVGNVTLIRGEDRAIIRISGENATRFLAVYVDYDRYEVRNMGSDRDVVFLAGPEVLYIHARVPLSSNGTHVRFSGDRVELDVGVYHKGSPSYALIALSIALLMIGIFGKIFPTKDRTLMERLAIVALVIVLFAVPIVPAHADDGLTVLRDESHGQYYKSDAFSVLLSDLSSAGITVTAISSGFLEAVKKADPGRTVIVIPNPEEGNFTADEIAALRDFVSAGGVLVLMSEVQYMTSSGPRKYGRPGTLNAIIFSIDPDAGVYFEGTDENGNEVYDEANNAGRPRQIKVSPGLVAPALRGGLEEPLVVTTSMVHADDPKYVLAFTESTAYAKSVDGSIIAKGNIPRLAYREVGSGKIVLSGSTQAFTDRMISLSSSNKVLFANLLSRATGAEISVEVLRTTLPIIDVVMIRLAMSAVVLYDFRFGELEPRERVRYVLNASVKYVFVVTVILAIVTMLEAAMMKAVFITTLYPGRSQPTSLENVPIRANAGAKYFFALLIDGAIGIFLGLVALRVERLRGIIVRYRKLLRFLRVFQKAPLARAAAIGHPGSGPSGSPVILNALARHPPHIYL